MQNSLQVARDKVETILRNHQPQPLEVAQSKEFVRIRKARLTAEFDRHETLNQGPSAARHAKEEEP